jgi:hypothetical protein
MSATRTAEFLGAHDYESLSPRACVLARISPSEGPWLNG